MGARSDFKQLYDDFRDDDFFSDAVFTFSYEITTGSTFDPITGPTAGTTESYSCEAFSLSSGDASRKPTERQFKDVQTNDVFASIKAVELPKPPLDHLVTFGSKQYKTVEIINDALGLDDDGVTYVVQLRA